MTGLTIPFIGLNRQYNNLRTEILDVTDLVLRSGQVMNGNYTAEFENWLAKKNQSKYAVTCHSGTSALELIAEYYATDQPIRPPKVAIPSLTFPATANAFARVGWDIYFVDTTPSGIIDVDKLPDIYFEAIVIVGLYGHSVKNLHGFQPRSQRMPMSMIEDGAQHWLSDGGRRIGSATAISFDPTKNLANYANGGAVITSDTGLYQWAKEQREHNKPHHITFGTNSRMSEVDCAQMLVKTKYINQWQERRQNIAQYWIDRLATVKEVRTLIDKNNIKEHGLQKFVIDVDNRNSVRAKLAEKKIETKVHYEHPLHEIGLFRQFPGPDMLSNATALSRRVLSLPFYPELTDLEVDYIADSVIESVRA